MSIGNICLAILVFSLIIIIHEFGHFIVAKINKVGVIEFSLGMGPRIISWGRTPAGRKVLFFKTTNYLNEHPEFEGNTLYSWKILPFGGSCMMLGEEEDVDDERAFGHKSVYARMAIIFAGPFFNFILAFILSLIVIGSIGYDPALVTEVEPGQPMAEAGLKEGDIITEINGRNIVLGRELSYYRLFHPFTDAPVEITYERNGEEREIVVTPELMTQEDGTQAYRLGFAHNSNIIRWKAGVVGTLKYAAYEVKFWIWTTVDSLGQMIQGKVKAEEISGPVGIVKTVGDVVDESSKGEDGGAAKVALNLAIISILLTANLGVMNLLPIPALDGGRLLFLIIEWIRRKPLPAKFENYVNVGGFMLLMLLMVFILINDVIKLV